MKRRGKGRTGGSLNSENRLCRGGEECGSRSGRYGRETDCGRGDEGRILSSGLAKVEIEAWAWIEVQTTSKLARFEPTSKPEHNKREWSYELIKRWLDEIVNIFCFSFRASTISQASLRAGTLSVINLAPLYAIPRLGALADLLGMALSTLRQIHPSAGVMAVLLAVFHVLVASRLSLLWTRTKICSGYVRGHSKCAASQHHSGALLCPRSLPFADLLTNSSSVHTMFCRCSPPTPSNKPFPRCYLFIAAGLFLSISRAKTKVDGH